MRGFGLQLAAVTVVMMLAACNEQSSPTAPIASQDSGATAVAGRTTGLSSQGVIEKATGSGHFAAGNGELRKFTFNAVKRADGSVSGQYQLVAGNADLTAHGTVTCLTVVGNQAWIAGTLDRNSVGAPFDTGRFRVVDNGEGSGSASDQLSVLFVAVDPTGALAAEYCQDTPEFPALNDVEHGNVQVH